MNIIIIRLFACKLYILDYYIRLESFANEKKLKTCHQGPVPET